jgi:acyl-homoserine-lactone acylase
MKKVCAVATLLCFALSVFSQRFKNDAYRFIDPSQINIVRDVYGVPHIFAQTDAEVAYGLAWAHAEDDFETIQKCFLASKSMLGQQLGRDGAKVDYVVHLLRLRELVEVKYEKDISEEYKNVLTGYCDGFNAYAASHPKEILEKKCFPIVPQDVLTYSILQLAIGAGVDEALRKIYDGSVELAEWNAEGSNAFAFNSNKTEDGSVFLAINTHHPLEGQVAWYEAHLVSREGWNIVGALFPGSPVIFTGINENLGWTHTVNHPDKVDVYQLEINPENALEYKVDGKWYSLDEEVVKLKVKVPGFNLHVKKKAYWSIYGPTVVTEKGTFAIRTAAMMDIRALEQWHKMNKAKSFNDFKKALKMEAVPQYNIVYADKFDTIYYLSNGRLPVRTSGFNWKGTLPGNTTKTLWYDIHPLEDLPQVLNPKSGYVYNTNHSPFLATAEGENINAVEYDSLMGYETLNNNRSLRVQELLNGKDKISYEYFKKIKYDLQLPAKLAFPVNVDTLFLLSEKQHPKIADVITLLKNWDRKGTVESKGATVFGVLFYYIAEKYKKDPKFTLMTEPMCIEAFYYAKDYLLKNFGKTQVPFGQYQRLERGEKTMPLPGLPDVLAAMYSVPEENGRVRGALGECYIALAKFTPSGPEIETINAFGASNHKDSKHYADQMKLFAQQKTKRMSLDENEVYRNAESIYHPEVLSKLPLTAWLNRNRR